MRKLLPALVLILFILPLASAQNLDMEFKIIGNDVLATYIIDFTQPSYQEIVLDLPKDARMIEVYSDGSKFESKEEDIIEMIRLTVPLLNTKQLKVNFISSGMLEKASKDYFVADLKIPLNIEELKISLILPEGAVLENPNLESVWPKYAELSSDGKSIIVEWSKQNAKEGESIPLLVIFRENKVSWILIFTIVVAIGASAILLFSVKRKNKKKVKKTAKKKGKKAAGKKEIYLLDSEKAVISLLEKAEGKQLWQKQIQLAAGFSKAKLSRLLRNLEARGLVKRIPIGNTNKIKLK